MDSTRHLARSVSCSTISFLPASSSSAASEPGHGLSLGRGNARSRGDSRALFAPVQVQAEVQKPNRNASLTLRRMSTFARFLRKSTSSNSRSECDRLKLHKRSRKNSCVGPEWISSPRDYTSCTLCDRFFVSGEDWLEHYGQCVDERENVEVEGSAQALATTASVRSPTAPARNALASASKAEEPYCETCDRYFTTSSALYHHRSESHPGSVPHDLCPICNVTCSLEEHLKHAVMHRAVPSPRSDAELGEIWPRCCFACDQTFDDIEAMKQHNRFLKRHNRIMHERQAETAADEWQSYCWPCDQYFASQADLDRHHRSCTSPLKLMTYIEGELLTAARLKSDNDSLVEETLEATYLASLPSLRNTEDDHDRDRFLVQSPTSLTSSSTPSLQVRTDRFTNGNVVRQSREENTSRTRRMSLAPIPSLSPLDLSPPEASVPPPAPVVKSPPQVAPSSLTEQRRSPPVSPNPQMPLPPQSPRQAGPSSPTRERRPPPAIPPKPPKPSSPPPKAPAVVKPSVPAKPTRGPPPLPPPVPPRSAGRPPSRPTTPASSPGLIHLPLPGTYPTPSPATQSLQAILRGIPPPPPITPSTEAQIRASIPLVFDATSTELRSASPTVPSASRPPLTALPLAARSEMNVRTPYRDSSDEDEGTAHSDEHLPVPSRSRLRVQSMIALKTLSSSESTSSSSSSDTLSDSERKPRLKRMSMAALSVAPAAYECPLCFEADEALSNIPCGHVFCTACIGQLLKREPQCPLCRTPAQPGDMRRVFLNT